MSDKHPIRTRIIGTIVAVAVISLFSYLGGWQWAFGEFRQVWGWFIGRVSVPVWLLCVLSIVAIGVIVAALAVVFFMARRAPVDSAPGYTEDTIFNIIWRWDYGPNRRIQNLTPFCPFCDLRLQPRATSGHWAPHPPVSFRCDNCPRDLHDFDAPLPQALDLVVRTIELNLKRMDQEKAHQGASA